MASLAENRIVEFGPHREHFDVEQSAEQPPQSRPEELRLLEALLFASPEPLDQSALAKRMPEGVDVKVALKQLQADYAHRGVNLVRVANKWTFRTAGDLAWLMTRETTETRKLSRAAIEMLAIIAYHQPITRAEIEDIRGVITSKGTLDVLLETGWVKPRGRRKTPGRPLTFGTTEAFLSQFSLEAVTDLPGLEELKGAGLLDTRLPTGFSVPNPSDDPHLREDEDPLEPGDLELALVPPVEAEPVEEPAAEGEVEPVEAAAATIEEVAEAPAFGDAEAEIAAAEFEVIETIEVTEVDEITEVDEFNAMAAVDEFVEGADDITAVDDAEAESEVAQAEAVEPEDESSERETGQDDEQG